MAASAKLGWCLCLSAALSCFLATASPADTNIIPGPISAARPAMSAGEAQAIIERVYNEVLHRAPDKSGLRSFTDNLLRGNKDEKWLRDTLRNSPEAVKLAGKARRKILLVAIPSGLLAATLLVMFIRRRNAKDFIFKLILLVGSVAFICLLAEVILRMLDGSATAGNARALKNIEHATVPRPGAKVTLRDMIQMSTNPGIVYDLIAGMSVKFMDKDVTTGSNGFRITPGSSDASNAVCIVGLGDSVLFGWGVNDGETYFSGLCRQLNADHAGPAVRGINTSVPGYNTVMEVETLKAKCLRYQPRLVIIHFVENDLWLPNFICTETPASELTKSHLLSAISRVFGGGLRTEPFGSLVDSSDAVPEKYKKMVGEQAYLASMKELGNLGRQHNFKVLIITNWKAPSYVLEAAKESGFLVLELGPTINDYCRDHGIQTYQGSVLTVSRRDPHYSALAHELVCKTVLSFTRQHQLLDGQN